MADFLARLAARSLGQLQSVQPRRASQFEPDAATSGAAASGVFEVEAEREQRAPQAIRPLRGTSLRPEEGQAEDGAAGMPRRRSEAQRMAAGLQGATDAMLEMEPVQYAPDLDMVAERPRDSGPTQAPPETAPLAMQSRSESPLDVDHHVEPQFDRIDMEPSPAAPAPVRLPPASATRIEPVAAVAQTRGPGDPEPGGPPPSTRHGAGDVVQVATRLPAPGERPAEDAVTRAWPAPEAAPQITMSIGRIEVKAAPSPAPVRPTQRPASPQPSLSLGEYLERSRRRRR
jgi:hypothetical protein